MKRSIGRIFGFGILALIVLVLLIQIIPYGKAHANPPVVKEPTWDSHQTRALAKKACFDCHSNETFWPWYSNVAPISWLVQRDVDEGRHKLNFSEWGLGRTPDDDISKPVQKGEMPPGIYLIQHPESRLTDAERQQLIQGLQNTFGTGEADE